MEQNGQNPTAGLKKIVEQFNQQFAEWSERTGCVANFGWRYSTDKQPKSIEILGIDHIVYRKPPPTFEAMAEAMKEQNKV